MDEQKVTPTKAAKVYMKPPFYKRKYLIDKPLQLPVIFYFVGLAAIVFVAMGLSLYVAFQAFIDTSDVVREFQNEQVSLYLSDLRRELLWMYLTMMVVGLFAMFLGGLFLSHRIAGPLYRLKISLNAIADGQPVREIQLRKGDFAEELAGAFNRFLKRFMVRQTPGK